MNYMRIPPNLKSTIGCLFRDVSVVNDESFLDRVLIFANTLSTLLTWIERSELTALTYIDA